ncbi:MAG TPA: hypothetical protein VGK20_12345 [Candidatus Binatia bacterium]|jgi:hypothetical protein
MSSGKRQRASSLGSLQARQTASRDAHMTREIKWLLMALEI